jgi:hypothetical protein
VFRHNDLRSDVLHRNNENKEKQADKKNGKNYGNDR